MRSAICLDRIESLRDVITFEGDSVGDVMQAFRHSVDDYLEFCDRAVRAPKSPIRVSLSFGSIRPFTDNWRTSRKRQPPV